ncbi:unnamed protein product [Linum tenue]|uniref:non-specific serine/threonine protein kinase n=1 Tax=Linum tenue TaxID=586396 RepID=A0AAV0IGV8_9ROSI|nr:unnamed protein product [Linum tenue]
MITGDPLGVLSSWNDSTHFCQWYGVSCSQKHIGRVTVLELPSNKLSGSISPHVGNLSFLQRLLLSNNSLIEGIPPEIGRLNRLQHLILQDNLLGGLIPSNISGLTRLYRLDLGDNKLQGEIPAAIGNCTSLIGLSFSQNNLSGTIPSQLMGLSSLSLHMLLSHNRLSGTIPISIGSLTNLGELDLSHNMLSGEIPASLGSCAKLEMLSLQSNLLQGTIPSSLSSLRSIKLLDISSNNLSGQFPKSFEGMKLLQLLNLSYNSIEGESFMAECAALKNIRHKNLVRILTVCSGIDDQMNDFKALVYEYLANGSLEDWLHPVADGNEPLRSLNFLQRLNVVIDVATAVDYIHHQCGTPIVHCDLKPSNVLLNEDMTGHVNDFGLARFLQPTGDPSSIGQMSSTIGIKGTIGYAPPEYGMGNEVSKQGDVYSYGVLLCEVFTGKRPTDEIFKEGLNIHTFVRTALSEKLMAQVLDPVLINELPLAISSSNTQETKKKKGQILEEVLISILEIGVVCSSDSPNERISIGEVVTRLVSLKNLLHDKFAQRQIGGM